MWCVNCQSDVVAEVGSNHRRVHCSICGTALGETAASQLEDQPLPSESHSRTNEAQQLLDRWAKSHIFDPYAAPQSTAHQAASSSTDANSASQKQPESSASTLASPAGISQTTKAQPHALPDPANSMPASVAEPSSSSQDVASLSRPEPTPAAAPSADQIQKPYPIAEPQNSTSPDGSQIANTDGAQSATNAGTPSESAAALESLLVSNGLKPTEQKPPAPQSGSLNATSDELDRLTHDIMSRVAQITEAKQQPQPEPIDSGTDLSNMAAPTAKRPSEPEAPNQTEETRHRPSSRLDPRPELENVSAKQWRVDSQEGQSTPLKSPTPKPHTPIPRTVAAEDLKVEHRELKSSVAKLREEQEQQPKKGGNWFGGLGQALAYMGILGLTAGTSLVILGYFGGPAQYAPTGWLITTFGQMLLFLGVVTLVSAGMEQTTVEVKQTVDESLKELTAKLEDMGDRIIRIEHKGHEPGPREPHFNSRVRTRETEHVNR